MPNSSNLFDHAYAAQLIKLHTIDIKDARLCSQPWISIIIHTYEHGPFLEQALESVLVQQINRPYEIIIGDDCSEDGAQEIGKSYQEQYPSRIRLLLSTKNLGQYTGGGRLNLLRSFQACRGQYVAYLEGDDYWTDPDKLQKQLDYMQDNPQTSGCFHDGMRVNERGETLSESYSIEYKSSYSQRECLTELRTGYPSASLFFKSDVIKADLPEYYLQEGSDFLLDLVIAEQGTLDYLPFIGCAYRKHAGGRYTGMNSTQAMVERLRKYTALLNDSVMKGRYESEIKKSVKGDFFYECLHLRRQGKSSLVTKMGLLNLKTGQPALVTRLLLLIKSEIFYYGGVMKAALVDYPMRCMKRKI